ncbi:hypothetical protein LPJ56_000902 [Coemansia sp. RSA 2599]|nr:hypothetical protein LPJ75_000503 [Coemansia sp. RSA 2598]KAJ1828764.1 hypothetical protein LPJ56_000902 [Coemansia sp. RSA 2599]
MKGFVSALAFAATLASSVNAHTYLSKLNIAGTQYDEGVCIRPYPANRNFPVKDPNSTDLTCGFGGVSSAASKNCPVNAGDKVTVEWHHDNDSAADDIIDVSHLGPCLVYMAPLSSNGAGDVWFKIFEDGYDAASGKWCVNKIRENGGKLDITIPSDIKAGDYLLRTEVIALHESDTDYAANPARGSQYYPNCAQVSVAGDGKAVPKGYAIPGIYKTNEPGIVFNLYSSYSSYPIPGPPVYVAGSAGGDDGDDGEEQYTTTASDEAPTPEYTTTSDAAPAPEYTASSSDAAPAPEYTASSSDEAPAPEYTTTSDAAPAPEYTASSSDVAPTSSAPVTASRPVVTVYVPGKCH